VDNEDLLIQDNSLAALESLAGLSLAFELWVVDNEDQLIQDNNLVALESLALDI
jgi:hypothetical protein